MSKRARQILFAVHSWIGVQLFFVMFVIMSTGTLAVFSNELDWLTRAEMRAPATSNPVSWQTVFESVRRSHPQHDIEQMTAPVQPGFAIEVLTSAPQGGKERIYVNPATGEVQGSHGWITIQRFLRNIHMNLFLPAYGIMFVASFGFFLLVSLVTGLLAYRRFWKGFLTRPRARNTRTLMGDLHRLGGIWSIWFVALISVTSIWYFIEDAVEYRWEADWPTVASTTSRLPGPEPHIPIATIEERVKSLWPSFEIDYIGLPTTVEEPITVGGHAEALLVRSRGNLIYLHPVTGAVLQIKDARSVPALERWIDTADPLHFGNFAGLVSKTIWFLFGVVLSFLSFSGFWLSLKRARRPLRAGSLGRSSPALVPT